MRCETCGAEGAIGARFCDQCGAAFVAGPTGRTPRDVGGEAGDRRIVTALFADLVDYVRMVAEHDPEIVRRRVRLALATIADAIAQFDGTREKFIGDAVFAVFGWPRAHDDDAVRASLAGLAIRDSLRDLGAGSEAMEVRVGIATGEVVAAARSLPTGDDLALTGAAITTAARIQSLAQPGEILLDAATVAAARGRLLVSDRGSTVLRGQHEAIGLHALEGELGLGGYAPHPPSPAGRFVGRAAELTQIRARLDLARTTGIGGTVLVVGEAGMGKSRLFSEAVADARDRGFAWTWVESTSYGQAEPYRFSRLFAQTVADEQGMDSGAFARSLLFTPDLEASAARRFGGAIATIAREAAFAGWEAEAADIPGDAATVTATLVEVAERYVDRLIVAAGPRVVVIDDLQWMDPSSVGMVEVLVRRSGQLPLVVLVGTRPGALPSWADLDSTARIDLPGLGVPETAQLATQVAKAALGAGDARRLHDRTGGNPLFVSETVRALLDDGSLARHDGRVAWRDDAPHDVVPLTLRAVLGARIDALAPMEREILGVASIVGMRFEASWIVRLMDDPPRSGSLEGLADAAMIVPGDDDVWRFAHPLIHDVAYAGVLIERRRRLHARIADDLEARHDPLAVSLIAVHRAASGDATRAIPLLDEAARSALTVGAAAEAASFWRTAAELIADPVLAADYRSRAAAVVAPPERA